MIDFLLNFGGTLLAGFTIGVPISKGLHLGIMDTVTLSAGINLALAMIVSK